MSHEITNTDDMVLHKEAAWHGLGNVVETAPSPGQALTLANLDWTVAGRSYRIKNWRSSVTNSQTREMSQSKALAASKGVSVSGFYSNQRPFVSDEMRNAT
jgi:hypothetical protein